MKSTLILAPVKKPKRAFSCQSADASPVTALSPLVGTTMHYYGNINAVWSGRWPTYLPLMTPSGLSMGMILKMKFSLKSLATGSLLTRNSKAPFITQLELLSPGWTRAVITWYWRCPIKTRQREIKPTYTFYFHQDNLQQAARRITLDQYFRLWSLK